MNYQLRFLLRCTVLCCVGFTASAAAQVIHLESETAGGMNDTFALAEDCRQLGSHFIIRGRVHPPGNPNSDDEWYRFDGAAGACLNITLTVTTAVFTGAQYQLNVWLMNSSQTMVASWNTASAVGAATIGISDYTLPASDTYYIWITEWSVAPLALSQPGLTFTPLSVRGYSVTGATPNATRNTGGGNQTFGSLYDLTVKVSSGNDAAFDVYIDRDPTTLALLASPSTVDLCWVSGGPTNLQVLASPKCPPSGVAVGVLGGGSGLALPGSILGVSAPGPEFTTSYTLDIGMGPVPGGQIRTVQALMTRSSRDVDQVDVCAGSSICFDVCATQPGSNYLAVLSEAFGPSVGIAPFLPTFDMNLGSFLFNLTFPVNQIPTILIGSQGVPGVNQVCLALPAGLIGSPASVYLQLVTFTSGGLNGLSPSVTLNLFP